MDKDKKKAAAIAAVTAYIKSEEEMAGAMGPFSGMPRRAESSGIWGISGRQSQMQIRNLMQLKAFHGAKLR